MSTIAQGVSGPGGLTVGRFRLDPIVEFEGRRMPPAAMFPNVGPDRLAALLRRVPDGSYDAATDQLVTSVHSWLVRDEAGLVLLVDTCFGSLKDRPTHPFFHMQQSDWMQRLERLGVRAGDVTHVVNTHLHLDHVGWNTHLADGAWRPTFPNARHLMPRVEAEIMRAGASTHMIYNERPWNDSVRPVIEAGLADLVDPPFMVVPGIRLIACAGHSPGMMVAEIAGGSGGGVMAGGDPLHHPLQVFAPDANTLFCEDPEGAAAARRAFLGHCADEGWRIAATHFCVPRVLSVRRDGDGFAWGD